ncbi:hypothetical protein BASP5262_06230 [Bacillus spizizenii]|nr:hypothetical protein DJ97_3704 [Bacillus spizizenii]SPT97876.1 Uncharacterised protein [Bacillus spizizenii]
MFTKQFHIGAANPMFCLIERFFKSSRALKSAVHIISVKKGMELTLHAFFIYKIEGKTGVWDVKTNTKARAAHVKRSEKSSKGKIEGG